MRLLPLLLALLASASFTVGCDAEDTPLLGKRGLGCEPPAERPACVDDFVNTAHATDRADEWSVREQCLEGQRHYWLDTGAPAYDGVDYIVNAACDTVCSVGGFRPTPACSGEYGADDWAVVWRG